MFYFMKKNYECNNPILSNICLDCKPINASTIINVPTTELYLYPYLSEAKNTNKYIITVLKYTFHTFFNLKNLFVNITTTNKDIINNKLIGIICVITSIPIVILKNIQNKCVFNV